MRLWDDPSPFDRLAEVRREPAAVAALWPDARVLTIADGSFVVEGAEGLPPIRGSAIRVPGPARAAVPGQIRLVTTPADEPYDPMRHHLVGAVDGESVFCRDGEADGAVSLREASPWLAPGEAALATDAVAMIHWHRLEPRCPRCGNPTVPVNGGMARHCAVCGRDLFPRTDPAVIVAIVDESDRILLGHQGIWAAHRYSVLAGFVEAGESLEQAIHREVFEEAGLRVGELEYVASQPWPFPRSIMLGFRARALTTDVAVDGEEIVDAHWFGRDELRAAVDAGEVVLPGEASIAYRLITDWLAG